MDHKKNHKANALLALQCVSDFGDQITAALLALCVLDISKSTAKVGLVYFITTIGYVIFTLIGGLIGDRFSKSKILSCCDLGRGFVVLLMILAFMEKSLVLIYCTSFLLSALSSLQRPTRISIWAETIPSKLLGRYNSWAELSIQISTIMGPLIASVFVMKSFIHIGFIIDALTFFLCAIAFMLIIVDARTAPMTIKPEQDFLHGFKLILRHREICRYVSYDAWQMIGFGAFNATFLVLAQRDFGWSKIEYSYHLSIIAIFCALGAFLGSTQLIAKIPSVNKLVFCAIISALALWILLLVQAFPLSSFLFGICNGMAVLTVTLTRTEVQLLAKNLYPASLASIIASRSIIIKGATLLGAGSCLVLDDFLSLQTTLVLFVIPIGISFIAFLPIGIFGEASQQNKFFGHR